MNRAGVTRRGRVLVSMLSALGLTLANPLSAAPSPLDIPYYLAVDLSQLEIAVETTEVGTVSREPTVGG